MVVSRPVEFNIRYDRYATLHRWSERFDPIVDITRTATNSVLKKITRPVARGRSRIAETTLPKTRGGDEWRQIDIAINERETEHFPRTVHAKILVAHSWHTFLQLALRSIDRSAIRFNSPRELLFEILLFESRGDGRQRGERPRGPRAARVRSEESGDRRKRKYAAVSWPASASTWRIAGWQLGSHRHFDFAFLGAFARLGAPLLPSSSHLNATSDPTDGGETRPRTLPSAAPPCFFALSKPGSAPLPLSSFSLSLSMSLCLSLFSLSLSSSFFV